MSTTEPIIPTIVSAQEAAEALGLTPHELYWNIRRGAAERLEAIAHDLKRDWPVAQSTALAGNLEHWTRRLGEVENLLFAAAACDEARMEDDEL